MASCDPCKFDAQQWDVSPELQECDRCAGMYRVIRIASISDEYAGVNICTYCVATMLDKALSMLRGPC